MGQNKSDFKLENMNQKCMEIKEYNTRLKSNIVLTLLGKLVSLFGTQIYSFAMGLYVLKVTGSGLSFANTMIFATLPRIIFGPIAGSIADKLDKKKLVVGMDILSGLVMFVFFLISEISGFKIVYIYIASFLLTTFNTLFGVAFTSAISSIVDDKNLMRISSLNQSIISIASIAGPFLGGIIFGLIDIKSFILFNGFSFVASAISECFIDFKFNIPKKESYEEERLKSLRENSKKHTEIKVSVIKNFINDLKDSFKFLKQHIGILILFIFAIFLNFLFGFGLMIPYPYIINNILKLSSKQFGIIEAMLSVGMLIASLGMSILPEFKKKYTVLIGSIFTSVFFMIIIGIIAVPQFMIFTKTQYFIILSICSILFGVDLVIMNVPIDVIMQRSIPNEIKGKIFGVLGTMSMSATPIAMLLSGILIDKIEVCVLPLLSSGIFIILMIIMIRNKDLKKLDEEQVI